MSIERTIIKNFFSLSSVMIITQFSSFILGVYVARVLGVDAFGQLAFASAYISFFEQFGDLGLTPYGVREIAKFRDKAGSLGSNILAVQTVIAALSLLVLFVSLLYLPIDKDTLYLAILFGFTLIPQSLNMSYVLRAYEQMQYEAFANLLAQIAYVLIGFSLVYQFKELWAVPVTKILTRLVLAGLVFYFLRTRFNFRFTRPSVTAIKQILKGGAAFLLTALALRVYEGSDLVLVQLLKGAREVGYYSAALKPVVMLLMFSRFVTSAVFPTLSKLLKGDPKRAEELVVRVVKYLGLVGLPLAVGGTILGGQIINLIYGVEYTRSVPLFSVLVWVIFWGYLRAGLGVTLNAAGYEKRYSQGTVYAGLIRFVLGLLFIPLWGVYGAGASMLITEFFFFGYVYRQFSRIFRLNVFSTVLRASLAAGVMGVGLLLVKFNVIIAVLFGAVVYFALLFGLRVIDEDDLSLLGAVISWGGERKA